MSRQNEWKLGWLQVFGQVLSQAWITQLHLAKEATTYINWLFEVVPLCLSQVLIWLPQDTKYLIYKCFLDTQTQIYTSFSSWVASIRLTASKHWKGEQQKDGRIYVEEEQWKYGWHT